MYFSRSVFRSEKSKIRAFPEKREREKRVNYDKAFKFSLDDVP